MCEPAPQLLYYIYIPIMVVILVLGALIFLSNRKSLSGRLFFLLSINISLWVFFTMMDWRSVNPGAVEIFTRLSLVGVVVPAVFLYFSYVFPDDAEVSFRKVLVIFLPLIPFIVLAGTRMNVEYIDASTPECGSVLGSLYYLIPLVSLIYSAWACFVLVKKFRNGNENVKKQIKFVLIGFLILMLWTIFTNVIAPFAGFDQISFFGPLGLLVFISLVAYAIVKYHFLSIKLLAAQALTFAIWILIGSQFFLVQNITSRVMNGFTFLVAIIFGIMLIKSIKAEVERKEQLQTMADRLAQANDKLRTLDNAKSEFISIASHQLRTPLTAIKGFVSLLIEGSYGKMDPKQADVLNKVYSSNDRLIGLVEDLLNISRIESGRMEFKFEKCKLPDLCQEVYDTFTLKAKGRGLSLEYVKPQTAIPEAEVDASKVREVISNLTDNALKYTERGGVTMRVEFVKGAEQKVACPEGSVRVIVSDTGIGIPQEELPYLFAKFSRGKDISRLNTGGTGLGLYVGKSMIEANGGLIWAESDGAGKGSRFIIELPLEQKKQ